jgi:hypothetical protein
VVPGGQRAAACYYSTASTSTYSYVILSALQYTPYIMHSTRRYGDPQACTLCTVQCSCPVTSWAGGICVTTLQLFNACVCLSSTPTIGVCAEDLRRRADDATQHAGPVVTLQRKRTCFEFYVPAVFTLTSTTP